MRQPLKIVLAVLLAAAFAAGCGSDDESSNGNGDGAAANGGGGGASTQAEGSPAAGRSSPKRSVRAEMVKCMEDAGFEVTHEGDDAEKATNYTIEAGGSKKAEIIIHANRNDATGSAVRAGEERAINSVPFGRAEFRRADTATNSEAGVLANCVAEAYVH